MKKAPLLISISIFSWSPSEAIPTSFLPETRSISCPSGFWAPSPGSWLFSPPRSSSSVFASESSTDLGFCFVTGISGICWIFGIFPGFVWLRKGRGILRVIVVGFCRLAGIFGLVWCHFRLTYHFNSSNWGSTRTQDAFSWTLPYSSTFRLFRPVFKSNSILHSSNMTSKMIELYLI